MLVREGLNKILANYFSNKDLYIGLWSNSLINNTITLEGISSLELDKNEYSRIKLDKSLWVINSGVISYPKITFKSVTQDWLDIKGYFISDTKDNTGNVILYETFLVPINVFKGDYLDKTINLTY